MSLKYCNLLPLEIIHNILTFDSRFIIRKGKLIQINKIDKNKYTFLMNTPKIKIIEDNIPEILIPIKNSVNFFCLMCTNYNNDYSFELQKVAFYNGNIFLLEMYE